MVESSVYPHSDTMLTGSLVAIVTPMKAGGALDLDALTRLCDWHVESEDEGEIIRRAGEHGRQSHGLKDMTRDIVDKVKSKIRDLRA